MPTYAQWAQPARSLRPSSAVGTLVGGRAHSTSRHRGSLLCRSLAEAHTGNLDTPFALHASGPDSTQDVDALLWPGDLMPEWLGSDTSNSAHQGVIQLESQAASSTCEATPPATQNYYDDYSIDTRRLLARSRILPLHEPAG